MDLYLNSFVFEYKSKSIEGSSSKATRALGASQEAPLANHVVGWVELLARLSVHGWSWLGHDHKPSWSSKLYSAISVCT